MERVLVSACLLGDPVRYNGADKRSDHPVMRRWVAEGRVVAVCPEVAGGLPVPRPPAEVAAGAGGYAVLAGAASVVDSSGTDVTRFFLDGARVTLATARVNGIRVAVLKEGSPSCGSSRSYDGTFTGTGTPHPGVAAALLRQNGIHVFSEHQLEEAERLLDQLERRG